MFTLLLQKGRKIKLQSWTKGRREPRKIKQNSFSMECFTANF